MLLAAPSLAADWTASVAATSNYLVNGLTRSGNEAAVQAHVGWIADSGWSAGVWASTVQRHPETGPRYELDLYLTRAWRIGRDLTASARVSRYQSLGDSALFPYDYTELAASLSFREAVTVTIAASPDYPFYTRYDYAPEGTSITCELSMQRPLGRRLQLSAGLGHADLQGGAYGAARYWYWSAGGQLAWRRLEIGLSYVGTDGTAERLFGTALAGNTWIATASFELH
jgi:conserved hypothetical protein, proteobacterial